MLGFLLRRDKIVGGLQVRSAGSSGSGEKRIQDI